MLAWILVSAAGAAPRVGLHVVPAATVASPGAPIDVAVVVRVPAGWHIYWENPGQSGLATDARLLATPAAGAAPTVNGPRWPVPARFEADGIVNYGYGGDTAFVFTVTPSAAGTVSLDATVDWLLCKEACVPGSGTASATVRVREGAPAPAPGRVARALAALPRPFAESGGTATFADGRYRLRLPATVDLFPSTALEAAGSPTGSQADGAFVVEGPLPPSPAHLVLGEGQGRGYRIDLPATEP